MSKNFNKKFLLLGLSVLFTILMPLFGSFVFAQDSYKVVKNGGNQEIDKHGVCKEVFNNRTDYDIFVPAKAEDEWLEFRIHLPENVVLDECGECRQGSDCPAGNYCESDRTCQPVPVCQLRVEEGYGTTDVIDNTQVTGCNSTCQACQDGACGVASAGYDPGGNCGTAGCGTGDCKGGSAECGYYISGEGNCSTCQTCSGASSPSCVNYSNNTQDTGCDGTCQACQGGACGAADEGYDPGYDCSPYDGGCATGDCKGGTAECGYYTSDWDGNCPTCQTCEGASSVDCEYIEDNTTASGCGEYSWEACEACQNGSCGVADAGTDPGYSCSPGYSNWDGCATGDCKGGTAECGYYTSGWGSCDVCDTCVGATSEACENEPIDTPTGWACGWLCDGMGNEVGCEWSWYSSVYPSTGSAGGSIDCKPSTEGESGYTEDSEPYCGTVGSYVGWGYDSIWYAECECY